MKSSNNIKDIKKKFSQVLSHKSEIEENKHQSLILMAKYLSEIDRICIQNGIKRNELAAKINISPSYLTQVFRGTKPLNFSTLAKIQKVLKIRFEVKAINLNASINPLLRKTAKPTVQNYKSSGLI